jgi:hypothetical protein
VVTLIKVSSHVTPGTGPFGLVTTANEVVYITHRDVVVRAGKATDHTGGHTNLKVHVYRHVAGAGTETGTETVPACPQQSSAVPCAP